MQPFTIHSGIVAPLDRANIDTDLIIPKQFLKSVKRTGFGPNLFDSLRYLDEGTPGADNSKRPLNPEFILNKTPYSQATILLARENFGCGSSREHAPWALVDFGFRAILAPSFADIFYNNCFKNSLLPVILADEEIDELFLLVQEASQFTVTIDLHRQTVGLANGRELHFAIDAFRRKCLLEGLDDIGLTLQKKDLIEAYEKRRQQECPWLFTDSGV
jgi:3-isopropylmalate/(R)-2-methylmalate dehydratase small subunit